MSLFNEKLKKISLKELLSLIIVLFLIQYLLNTLNIVQIDSVWIYILVIFFFIFKVKNEFFSIKSDILQLRNADVLKSVLRIVILNIFFSYGMLYFSDFMLNISNQHNLFNSALTAGLLATIFVSPISEELIFRGVFLNRLQLAVPLTFAVLISSLLFAALHSFGGIFSAFIFAVCVAILYLKTDNICVPILAHFLNNLFAEIIVVLDSGRILFTNDSVMCLVSVLAICSFVLILRFIVKELNTISHNNL